MIGKDKKLQDPTILNFSKLKQ